MFEDEASCNIDNEKGIDVKEGTRLTLPQRNPGNCDFDDTLARVGGLLRIPGDSHLSTKVKISNLGTTPEFQIT
jgi:hypothetical protein